MLLIPATREHLYIYCFISDILEPRFYPGYSKNNETDRTQICYLSLKNQRIQSGLWMNYAFRIFTRFLISSHGNYIEYSHGNEFLGRCIILRKTSFFLSFYLILSLFFGDRQISSSEVARANLFSGSTYAGSISENIREKRASHT